jgi:hypothetical protein
MLAIVQLTLQLSLPTSTIESFETHRLSAHKAHKDCPSFSALSFSILGEGPKNGAKPKATTFIAHSNNIAALVAAPPIFF